MVKITIGPEWAWINTQSIKKGKGNVPFCFSGTKKLFQYDKYPDSFPENGVAKLPFTCSDLRDIVVTKSHEQAWRQFFKEAEARSTTSRDAFIKYIQSDNTCSEAVKLLNKWFEKLRKRSGVSEKVDEVLLRTGYLIWQVYINRGLPFPLPRKVSQYSLWESFLTLLGGTGRRPPSADLSQHDARYLGCV